MFSFSYLLSKGGAKQVLVALAGNPNRSETDLLRLLERKDLPVAALRAVAVHPQSARSYRVKLGLVSQPLLP